MTTQSSRAAAETAVTTQTAVDRLALMLAAPRSRRGLLALGAAALAAAAANAAPAPALAKAGREDAPGKRLPSRNRRIKGSGPAAAADVAPKLPPLDPGVFAANPALNEFNLLMNRLVRNHDAWLIAIAAPVPSARRQKVAALGLSVAADLGKIASHEKTFLSGGATTWVGAGAKMKEWGVDAELGKFAPNLTVDGAAALLGANLGVTIGGVNAFYASARPAIEAEIGLIRKQASEIAKTGVVTVRTPVVQSGASGRVAAQRRTCKRVACILYVLATVGIFLAAAAVMTCMAAGGPTNPVGLVICLGYAAITSAIVIYNLAICLSANRC